ncbi:MAG TPA: winged helix-turn-helix domain-containing protein, partial [Gemmatimonadales bacterium]|nr:winged helix-turn-helix domain-containing protein [Gemmatimonadales bacterium]
MRAARPAPPAALLLPLDAGSEVPLYRQLYRGLREAVLTGALAAGSPLPSTRALAEELGVSRNTVVLAFDQLTAEGYLEGAPRSGTMVARALPRPSAPRRAAVSRAGPGISARGRAITAVPMPAL